MGAHVSQLVRHMILYQIVLARQSGKLRALFQRIFGIKQGLQLCAPGKLRAQFAPFGQKTPLGAAECCTGSKAAGVFYFCVFPAGDLFVHAFLLNRCVCFGYNRKRAASAADFCGRALPRCLVSLAAKNARIQNGRPRIRAGVTMQGLYQAFFTVSTRAAKLLGSLIAISDSILRFSSMPAFFRPAIKVE